MVIAEQDEVYKNKMENRRTRWGIEEQDGGQRNKMEDRGTRWRREEQDGGQRNKIEKITTMAEWLRMKQLRENVVTFIG